jgi:hypothetical protein
MYITRQMRAKRQDESFLSALEPGGNGGDAVKMLLRVLADREPKELRTWRNYTIMATPDTMNEVIEILRTDVTPRNAAFGEIENTFFVAVPYNKERLVKNLIRSTKRFREVHKGTRLILDEGDLLNTPREFPKDRAYKDDE